MLMSSASAVAKPVEPIEKTFDKYKCMNCHTIYQKFVGPSFQEIAQKYRGLNMEASLVHKISVGGGGVWVSGAMPAIDPKFEHQADIKRLVTYILKLK